MESNGFEAEERSDLGGLDASGVHATSSALSDGINGHEAHVNESASLALEALLQASNDIEARTTRKIRGHFALGAWICDVSGCAKSFPSMEQLKVHLEESHGDENIFVDGRPTHTNNYANNLPETHSISPNARLKAESSPCPTPALNIHFLTGDHPQSNSIETSSSSSSHLPPRDYVETPIDAILATDLLSPTLPKVQTIKHELQPAAPRPWICNIDHCFRDYSSESRLIRHQRENHRLDKRYGENGVDPDARGESLQSTTVNSASSPGTVMSADDEESNQQRLSSPVQPSLPVSPEISQPTADAASHIFPTSSSSALDSIAAVASVASPLTVPGPLPSDTTSPLEASEDQNELPEIRSGPRKRVYSEMASSSTTRSLRPRRTTIHIAAGSSKQTDSNSTSGPSTSVSRQAANAARDGVVMGLTVNQLRSKRFVCPHEDCGRSYLGMKELQRHQLNHEPPQFRCKYCGREWHRYDVFVRHFERKPVCKRAREADVSADARNVASSLVRIPSTISATGSNDWDNGRGRGLNADVPVVETKKARNGRSNGSTTKPKRKATSISSSKCTKTAHEDSGTDGAERTEERYEDVDGSEESRSGSESSIPVANMRPNPSPVSEAFYGSSARPAPFRRPIDQDIDPRLSSNYEAYIYDGTHSRSKLSSTRASGMDEQDGEDVDGERGPYESRSEDAYQPLASHYTHHVYPSTHDPTSRAYLHLPPPPGRGTYQYSPAHRNQVHPHHSVIQPYPYPMAPDVPLYTANPSPQMPHAQVGYSSGPSGPPLHSRTPTHLNGNGNGRREDDRSSNRSRRSSVSDRGFNPGSDEWTTEKMWE